MTDLPTDVPSNPEPILPTVEPIKQEKPGSSKGKVGALTHLPPDVKKDMENWMVNNSAYSAKEYMATKYGDKFPELKVVSRSGYIQYFKRHRKELTNEATLQLQSAPLPPETLGIINAITEPTVSLADKRKALTALYTSCDAQIKLLELRRPSYPDPQNEAIILATRKEMRIIIEKLALLNDQLSKDAETDFLVEMQNLVSVVLSTVYTTYRLVNADHNYSLFQATLDENLTNTLKSYTLAKERQNLK